MRRYLSYYRRAISLLNEHLYIFLFTLILTEANILFSYFAGTMRVQPVGIRIISFFIGLAVLSYLFIPVILFNDALGKKRSSIIDIVKLMGKNILRTLKPAIFGGVFIIICLAIIYRMSRPTNDLSQVTYLIILLSFLNPLFGYFGICYMVEKRSLVSSLTKSFSFSLHHFLFSFLPLPFLLINTVLVNNFVFDLNANIYLKLAYYALSSYIMLLITAAYLIYYRRYVLHKP